MSSLGITVRIPYGIISEGLQHIELKTGKISMNQSPKLSAVQILSAAPPCPTSIPSTKPRASRRYRRDCLPDPPVPRSPRLAREAGGGSLRVIGAVSLRAPDRPCRGRGGWDRGWDVSRGPSSLIRSGPARRDPAGLPSPPREALLARSAAPPARTLTSCGSHGNRRLWNRFSWRHSTLTVRAVGYNSPVPRSSDLRGRYQWCVSLGASVRI